MKSWLAIATLIINTSLFTDWVAAMTNRSQTKRYSSTSRVNAVVRLNNPKGTRVEHLDIAGQPFDANHRYKIAGAGEQDMKDAESKQMTGTHAIDALRRHFEKHSPVNAKLTHAKFVAV